MSQTPWVKQQQTTTPALFELLNAEQLSARLNLPESWVREMTRSRTSDPIPHLRFGRYVRFKWGAPELADWIGRRMRGGRQ
jgi:hypothetical protein